MYVNYKIPRGPSDVRIAFLALLKQRSPIKLSPLELVMAVTSWLCHLAVKRSKEYGAAESVNSYLLSV